MDETSGAALEGRPGPASRAIPVALAAILAGAMLWSYAPTITYLVHIWGDSNYSHGWLIAPIALAILWQRRESLAEVEVRPRWWGVLPLAAILASRYWLFERNEQWIEAVTLPLALGAAVLAVAGRGPLRWALPGLVYLFLMLPLPPSIDDKLAGPLQTLATIGSVSVLQALGTPVLAEGNVILIGSQRLEVAEACRGLSMLLSFVALISAMVILVRRPLWERVVLVLSTVPIALLCNIIRIATTALLYERFNRPVQEVHDWAGLAMMVLALGFVLLELKVMSWLVVEEAAGAPGLVRPGYGDLPPGSIRT